MLTTFSFASAGRRRINTHLQYYSQHIRLTETDEQQNIFSTSVSLIGYSSGLDVSNCPAERKAVNVGGNYTDATNMTLFYNHNFTSTISCRTVTLLLTLIFLFSCKGQSPKDSLKPVDTSPKKAPESLHFTAHIVEPQNDGSRAEIDTITGYRKYYYKNGKLQMEGKVIKDTPKDYRDGVWSYYNEAGQLMNQETYNKKGKVNQLEFMYFTNGKPLSKTYQYYEGDYKDKTTFKFHKIETLFYTNGQELSERHSINGNILDEKCWDSKGNPKPIEYLKTIKSVQADE